MLTFWSASQMRSVLQPGLAICGLFASVSAMAAECPLIPELADAAWVQFDDAELDAAKAILMQAYESLSCQQVVVERDELKELYWLDGLVSLAQEDEQGAVYATLRAVSVDPEALPPSELGPELAQLFRTWTGRLGDLSVSVSVTDGGEAWVDGRSVRYGRPQVVVEGDHLVQVMTETGLSSEVLELSRDLELVTGRELNIVDANPDPNPDPIDPDPDPIADPDPDPIDPYPINSDDPTGHGAQENGSKTTLTRKRRHPAWLWATGITAGSLGGGTLASGYWAETKFISNEFSADEYNGCRKGGPCYEDARQEVIRAQAKGIRATYAVGYGMVGVGAALALAGAIGLPLRTDGTTVSVHLRW